MTRTTTSPAPAATNSGGRPAEVVPLPEGRHIPGAPPPDGAVGGFMSKFQVHFPHTGNDNPARRITSGDHRDSRGYVWRLVLHPWGHDERGCYSVFLELANSDELPNNHQRFVRLEFAMHAWDAAYQMEPVKTRFLLHKFCDQATDFGYGRAFEHDLVMARRQTFIDPQGFVRISVRIIDVQEAFFRVAVDANLSRSITGGGGGGDFADWGQCNTAGSFKHDNLLHVVEKIAELAKVPLVSCRPWLCMPRPGGAIRPVAALLPVHLKMTISEALGDRDQYHLYLEEVDVLQEVWDRRRAVGGPLPQAEARVLLMSGRAYAQLPPEVHLVFLKIDRRILAAHAHGGNSAGELSLNPAEEAEFMFIGKAMAHKSDKGSELVPIAQNLARLPDTVALEVFEQLGPDEVRRFKPDTTVEEAGLCHGSILLFRGVHAQAPPCRPPAAIPPPSASAVACLNPMAAAAAAAAAVAASTAGAAHAAGAAVRPLIAMPSPVTAAAAIRAATGAAGIAPSPSPPHGGAEAPMVSTTGGGGDSTGGNHNNTARGSSNDNNDKITDHLMDKVEGNSDDPDAHAVRRGEKATGKTRQAMAPGWDKGAGTWSTEGESGSSTEVLNDAEFQRRTTCLALYQVQEAARLRHLREAAKAATRKVRNETAQNPLAAPTILLSNDNAAPPAANITPKQELTSSASPTNSSDSRENTTVAGSPTATPAGSVLPPAPPLGTLQSTNPNLTPEMLATAAAAATAATTAACDQAELTAGGAASVPTTSAPMALAAVAGMPPVPELFTPAARVSTLGAVTNGVQATAIPSTEWTSTLAGSVNTTTAALVPISNGICFSPTSMTGTASAANGIVAPMSTPSAATIGRVGPVAMGATAGVGHTNCVSHKENSAALLASQADAAMDVERENAPEHCSSANDDNSSMENESARQQVDAAAKRINGTTTTKPYEAVSSTSASVRPLRGSRSAAAAAVAAETSAPPAAPVATTAGGEQRRSCRKAAAVATLQISSISAPRGLSAGLRDATVGASVSTGSGAGAGSGHSGGAEARSSGDSGGRMKRHGEGQEGEAPRKIAKTGRDSCLSFSMADYNALLSRMERVSDFTIDKMHNCLRSMETIEIAKAIVKVGPQRTEELNLLEKLVSAREREDAKRQGNASATIA